MSIYSSVWNFRLFLPSVISFRSLISSAPNIFDFMSTISKPIYMGFAKLQPLCCKGHSNPQLLSTSQNIQTQAVCFHDSWIKSGSCFHWRCTTLDYYLILWRVISIAWAMDFLLCPLLCPGRYQNQFTVIFYCLLE